MLEQTIFLVSILGCSVTTKANTIEILWNGSVDPKCLLTRPNPACVFRGLSVDTVLTWEQNSPSDVLPVSSWTFFCGFGSLVYHALTLNSCWKWVLLNPVMSELSRKWLKKNSFYSNVYSGFILETTQKPGSHLLKSASKEALYMWCIVLCMAV